MNFASFDPAQLVRRHCVIGWSGLALFSFTGLALEALHGLKVGMYLDVGAEPRRLLWTLAHAHGSMLSIVHLAFAAYLATTGGGSRASVGWTSRSLTAGLVLLPAGFGLGGIWLYGGDPGVGILLAPIGGGAFVVAMVAAAIDARRLGDGEEASAAPRRDPDSPAARRRGRR
ncbi:MAG: hypothetical protein ACRCT8_04620 [Lacipirellulaceae bacterium]